MNIGTIKQENNILLVSGSEEEYAKKLQRVKFLPEVSSISIPKSLKGNVLEKVRTTFKVNEMDVEWQKNSQRKLIEFSLWSYGRRYKPLQDAERLNTLGKLKDKKKSELSDELWRQNNRGFSDEIEHILFLLAKGVTLTFNDIYPLIQHCKRFIRFYMQERFKELITEDSEYNNRNPEVIRVAGGKNLDSYEVTMDRVCMDFLDFWIKQPEESGEPYIVQRFKSAKSEAYMRGTLNLNLYRSRNWKRILCGGFFYDFGVRFFYHRLPRKKVGEQKDVEIDATVKTQDGNEYVSEDYLVDKHLQDNHFKASVTDTLSTNEIFNQLLMHNSISTLRRSKLILWSMIRDGYYDSIKEDWMENAEKVLKQNNITGKKSTIYTEINKIEKTMLSIWHTANNRIRFIVPSANIARVVAEKLCTHPVFLERCDELLK